MNTSLTTEPSAAPNESVQPATESVQPATETTGEAAPEAGAEGAAASVPDSAAAPAPDSAPAVAATGAPAGAQSAAPAPSARALLKQLQQQFPAFRDSLPLSIGIDKQILAHIPGIDRKLMRAALGIHTGSQRYLRTMEKATVRFDLDGTQGAEVTDVHRKHAKDTLQERFRKEADRKKAERDAAVEEEASRRRQEKLEQLTAKFSRKG